MNMIFVQYQPHLLDTDRSTVLIRTQAPGLAKDLLTFGKYLCCCNWTLMADLEAWAPSHSKHLIVFWKYQARQTQYISTSCSVVHLLTLFISSYYEHMKNPWNTLFVTSGSWFVQKNPSVSLVDRSIWSPPIVCRWQWRCLNCPFSVRYNPAISHSTVEKCRLLRGSMIHDMRPSLV